MIHNTHNTKKLSIRTFSRMIHNTHNTKKLSIRTFSRMTHRIKRGREMQPII
jgi:hypothetical protein